MGAAQQGPGVLPDVWFRADSYPQNLVFVTIKNFDGDMVWTEKILVDEGGNFSTLVIAGINGWSKSGTYEILLESGSMNESTTFFYESGGGGQSPTRFQFIAGLHIGRDVGG